jgi:hypothetical protein
VEPALNGARHSERGAALVAALAGTLLMLALGSALVLITATEVGIGGRYARGAEVLAGTELVLDRALLDLQTVGDWNLVLNGTVVSSLTDGPPAGVRTVADVSLDLSVLTGTWRCGRASCSDAEQSAVTAMRPWGSNNPRWQPFAWTPLAGVLAGWEGAPVYVMVWVADDPAENDADPLRDGAQTTNPGRDTVVVLAEGRGAGGLRRVLEATVRRTRDPGTDVPDGLELLAWREVR